MWFVPIGRHAATAAVEVGRFEHITQGIFYPSKLPTRLLRLPCSLEPVELKQTRTLSYFAAHKLAATCTLQSLAFCNSIVTIK